MALFTKNISTLVAKDKNKPQTRAISELPRKNNKGMSYESTHTEPDGNCAFNAFALGLCDLVLRNKLEDKEIFYKYFKDHLELEKANAESFKIWLRLHPTPKERQERLQVILRKIAVDQITQNYEAIYRELYQERLWTAYERFKGNKEKDDTFMVHPNIVEKFKEIGLSKEILLEWWEQDDPITTQSPRKLYFGEIEKPARFPMDKPRWGGEPELGALAIFFGITIFWQKDGAERVPLGVEGGIVEKIHHEHEILLRDLNIGDRLGRAFRLKRFTTREELENAIGPLREPIRTDLEKIIKDKGEHDLTLPEFIGSTRLVDIRNELKRRGILINDAQLSNDNGVLARKRILNRINGIKKDSDLYKAYLPPEVFKLGFLEFGVRNAGNHWTYLKPIANHNEALKEVRGQLYRAIWHLQNKTLEEIIKKILKLGGKFK